jgi:hypothetical protein
MENDPENWYVLGAILPPDYVKQPVLAGPFETLEEAQASVPQLRQDSAGRFDSWLIAGCPAHLRPGDVLNVTPEATEFVKADYPELEELVRERLKNPKLDYVVEDDN